MMIETKRDEMCKMGREIGVFIDGLAWLWLKRKKERKKKKERGKEI
jgi:hypothetical protein